MLFLCADIACHVFVSGMARAVAAAAPINPPDLSPDDAIRVSTTAPSLEQIISCNSLLCDAALEIPPVRISREALQGPPHCQQGIPPGCPHPNPHPSLTCCAALAVPAMQELAQSYCTMGISKAGSRFAEAVLEGGSAAEAAVAAIVYGDNELTCIQEGFTAVINAAANGGWTCNGWEAWLGHMAVAR